ncbi:early endosome antigen 1-like [Salvelinus namaycush]|uniref:Early endosome antigen 1-like n=1 Tax=Salvelinus namaycush TaxID=8040 RepID=A0A8U0PIA7_SALNM|nr:early endosome antigen 1-like [Salvelinus namaycush]
MLRYSSPGSVTTTEDSSEQPSERRIQRLRLTLHTGDNGQNEIKKPTSDTQEEKVVNGTWKKNRLIQRERPAGSESPVQQLRAATNGELETSLQRQHGPKVYGVLQRTGSDRQQEVMACEWSVNHLRDEMRYIREVRDSLEKVRERMYGQVGGMQQSMQKLSQDIRTANSQRKTLEKEVRVRTAAMDSFDQMNSSLISANIDLQKSLLESCHNRVDSQDEMKSLRSSFQQAEERLKERERQLELAQAENCTLKLKVESSQEANSHAVQEVTARLQRQYEERLQEEQRKHREEIEKLQAQIDEYIRRLEEAEKNAKIAEAKIAERDQRISEVERLLDCMGQERGHLQKKLQECEQRLRSMEVTYKTDATVAKSSQKLEEEAGELRERIKHLNDMVFCQQRKVKGMIEEVESLRAKLAQKDMFISELLDRIAIVECENNELEDKLKYFMSVQSVPREVVQTREIGVGCDLLPRPEIQGYEVETNVQPPAAHYQPRQTPIHPSSTEYLGQSRTFRSGPPPPSRLESSLLRYSPPEYSRYLSTNSSRSFGTLTSPTLSSSGPLSPDQSSTEESASVQITDTASSPEADISAPSCSRARSSPSKINTPFMKLIEITAKINIETLTMFSSSWAAPSERQGQVGDLKTKSKEELDELLSRQDKLLSNKRFIQTLPDKGKKISDFAERLCLALAQNEEEEMKQDMLSSVRTELQSKYQQTLTQRQHGSQNKPETSQHRRQAGDTAPGNVQELDVSPLSPNVQKSKTVDTRQEDSVSKVSAAETMEMAQAGGDAGASLDSDRTKESDLAEALQRVTLSDHSTGSSGSPKDTFNRSATGNPFLGRQPQKKPHYIEVLARTEKDPAMRRQKYKPNQFAHNTDGSPSGSLSPSQSPGGLLPSPVLSVEARRERDRKHIDDITAARLPLLHYSPAQLLTLEQSADLLLEQTRKHQELQAKLAAQKLSEGLRFSTGSYVVEGGPLGAYREVHDDVAQLSSEED